MICVALLCAHIHIYTIFIYIYHIYLETAVLGGQFLFWLKQLRMSKRSISLYHIISIYINLSLIKSINLYSQYVNFSQVKASELIAEATEAGFTLLWLGFLRPGVRQRVSEDWKHLKTVRQKTAQIWSKKRSRKKHYWLWQIVWYCIPLPVSTRMHKIS
jgi:hypothetical protein